MFLKFECVGEGARGMIPLKTVSQGTDLLQPPTVRNPQELGTGDTVPSP